MYDTTYARLYDHRGHLGVTKRNGGGEEVYGSAQISVTKVHGPTLLLPIISMTREWAGVKFAEKVTLSGPHMARITLCTMKI